MHSLYKPLFIYKKLPKLKNELFNHFFLTYAEPLCLTSTIVFIMNQITLSTYNINSVRLRLQRVKNHLIEQKVDILCLQETKVTDNLFPTAEFNALGYDHIYMNGEKSYNGVAIISRIPLSDCTKEFFCNDHARHISARLNNGTEIHNIYIPAGGDEPDPTINPKFAHKLDYLGALKNYFTTNYNKTAPLIMVGDFNIAPYEHDVWSHKQLLKVVSHTPIEIERLEAMRQSLDWIDVSRQFIPEDQKLYSWWSYRNRDWRKSNRGRRLDHIWVTPPLKDKIDDFAIHTDLRDGEKPSDHVPITLNIAL